MKKIILSAILLTGSVVFANAQAPAQTPPEAPATEQTTVEEGYKTVEISSLNEAVRTAVQALAGDAYEIKSVEFDAAKELTKVTLTGKADEGEKCVILDKEGKEVK